MIIHGDRIVSAFDCDLVADRFPDERYPDFYVLDFEAATGIRPDQPVLESKVCVTGLSGQVA